MKLLHFFYFFLVIFGLELCLHLFVSNLFSTHTPSLAAVHARYDRENSFRSDLAPPKKRERKLSKKERDIKKFNEALDRSKEKIINTTQEWHENQQKYECMIDSDFNCEQMIIKSSTDLPTPYRGACSPSFVVVGTAKSGTTSLYFYLIEHPQVIRALSGQFEKEVRFFDEFWSRGPQWYLQQFPPITKESSPDKKIRWISGEASPTYFYDNDAPSRIQKTLPNAKLIVLLRDPVERTYSDKMQLVANNVIFRRDPYEDAKYQIDMFNSCFKIAKRTMEAKEAFYSCYSFPKLSRRIIRSHPYVMDSIYVFQVRHWLSYFSRDQILFIKGEDMFTEPIKVMERVAEFLGICPIDWTPFVQQVHNRREKPYPAMPENLRSLLTSFYKEYTSELYRELDVDYGWESMKESFVS